MQTAFSEREGRFLYLDYVWQLEEQVLSLFCLRQKDK